MEEICLEKDKLESKINPSFPAEGGRNGLCGRKGK